MQISENGVLLIKQFEGFSPTPYLDSTGIPTIGYGTIIYTNGTRVTMNDFPITEEQATQYLANNIDKKTANINEMLMVTVNQNQFDSLASFAYNLGIVALHGSTLLRLVNQGNFDGAAEEFPKWDHAGGHAILGLTRRRAAEQQLFLTPC